MKAQRVFYMAGPGDVIGTYEHWRDGVDDPQQVSVAYSNQFYEVCQRNGWRGSVVSYCPRRAVVRDGGFRIEHLPVPFQNRSGALFHLGWYAFSLAVAWRAIRERADVAVLMTGTHLVPYWLLRLFGTRIVMTQHCVLWPKLLGARGAWKLVHALDRSFFRNADAILSISDDVSEQIAELTGGRTATPIPFLPTYRPQTFDGAAPAAFDGPEFRVLFAGRVERDKGALELVEVARLLADLDRSVVIDVAGDGGALEELRESVRQAGLESAVRLHGYCQRDRMRELFRDCHAVIVPTQSDMIEGFNKVVAEAVLAWRPVITSAVCPALEVVRDAAVEVTPGEARSYADAIRRLATDRDHYVGKVAACDRLREAFLDPEHGWGATLEGVLKRLGVVARDEHPRRTTADTPDDNALAETPTLAGTVVSAVTPTVHGERGASC